MANNIFQQQITPIKPKVLENERVFVYVPTADKSTPGIASFNERDFGVNSGHVSLIWPEKMLIEQLANPINNVGSIKVLSDEFINTNNVASVINPVTGAKYDSYTAEVRFNRKNRNAFNRPDFVMLSTSDFESSTTNEGYVKYTLKVNDPLLEPSLIQISSEDFIRENGIVKINWSNVDKVDTKLNDVINNIIKIGDANYSFATKGATSRGANNIAIGQNSEAWNYLNTYEPDDASYARRGAIALGYNARALSDAIAIGNNADAYGSFQGGIAIGDNSVGENGGIAIGSYSYCDSPGAAIGQSSEAKRNSTAIGFGAKATGLESIQIGMGRNTKDGTVQFRDFTIIDKDGKVYTNNGTSASIDMKLVATEEYVRSLFNGLSNRVHLKVVDELPTTDIQTNIIYLVPMVDTNNDNYYEEFVYLDNKWELLGTTKIDLTKYYTIEQVDKKLLLAHKSIILGADGVVEDTVYSFVVDNAESYIEYRTNGTKFLVDLSLPVSGDIDLNKKVAITFGNTSYYVYNVLKNNEPITIRELMSISKYNNDIGYRFITDMTFFINSDIEGFAIIPTVSVNDILSLDSDQMDMYLAEGGLRQGQVVICNKVITNGYSEGGFYRFDITYPDTYSWTELSSGLKIDNLPRVIVFGGV